MYKILICDDEKDIVNALKIYLSSEEYSVVAAYDGEQAVRIVQNEEVHLVLLDIMMPKKDGISAISEIRKFSNVPIIMITAKSEDTDKILGLNLGADDYITKPFNPVEVTARVRSQLRRYAVLGGMRHADRVYSVGGLSIDDERKVVSVDGEAVSLTPIEYDILKLLVSHPGKVYTSRDIYREVWHDPQYGAEGTVPVHIRHLREKIEVVPSEPRYIKVVWGRGYTLRYDGKQE